MIKTLKQTVQTQVAGSNRGDSTILICSFANADNAKQVDLTLNPLPYVIDWGDGTSDTNSDPYIRSVRHTYSDQFIDEHKTKTFNITIDGDINVFDTPTDGEPYSGIKSLIVGSGPLCKKQKSAMYLFDNCINLNTVPPDLFKYCSIKNFYSCFRYSGIKSVPKNLFNSAQPHSSFASVFINCENLESCYLEFGGPNSKTFNDFTSMFNGCTNLKHISPDLFKNVSSESRFSNCFRSCTQLNIPETLLQYVPDSNVNFMFQDVLTQSNIKSIPRNLFSQFDDSVLNSFFKPFAFGCDSSDVRLELDDISKNKIMMTVGSKQVSLKALIL